MTALTLWLQWRRSRVVALLLCGFLAFQLLMILPTLAMGIGRLFSLGMMLVALWAAIRAARATQRLAVDAEPDAGAV